MLKFNCKNILLKESRIVCGSLVIKVFTLARASSVMVVKALIFAIMICGAVALFKPVSETHRFVAICKIS